MAMYRATGQAHKPTPLIQTTVHCKNSAISRIQGGKQTFIPHLFMHTFRMNKF